MANMSEMGTTTFNWFNRKDVDKLREILHVSAQQHRSVLYEDWPLDIWNLSSEFGLFYEDNFDDYCNLKATSLFSNESLVVQSEIEEHYKQTMLLVNLYQHNVSNLIPGDRVSPSVISLLAEISPSVPECALTETPHVPASTGMPNLEVVDDSEVRELGISEDSNSCEYIVETCESDTFADVQTVDILDVHISNEASSDECRSCSHQGISMDTMDPCNAPESGDCCASNTDTIYAKETVKSDTSKGYIKRASVLSNCTSNAPKSCDHSKSDDSSDLCEKEKQTKKENKQYKNRCQSEHNIPHCGNCGWRNSWIKAFKKRGIYIKEVPSGNEKNIWINSINKS